MQEKKPFVDVRVAGEKERGRERQRESERERQTERKRDRMSVLERDE